MRSDIRRFALAATCCGAMVSTAALAGPISADLFGAVQGLNTPGGGSGSASSQVDSPGIIGGNREVVVGQAGGVHRINSSVDSGTWRIAPLGGLDVDQGFARMTWDRSGGSTTAPDFGGPGFDLTGGGTNDRWLMTYRSPTLASFWNTTLKLYTDGGNWIQYEIAGPVAPASGSFNGVGNVLNPGSGAGGITRSGSVDFANVRAIELTLSEPRAADETFRIEVLGLFFLSQQDALDSNGRVIEAIVPRDTTVIPLPGAALLFASALGLFGTFVRRRRGD